MARAKKRAGRKPPRSTRVLEGWLDAAERAEDERVLSGLERVARVASVLGPMLAAVLGPRHPPVPPVPEMGPGAFTYVACDSCADCPTCGLPRRAHEPPTSHARNA